MSPVEEEPNVRLDEYDKQDWFDVCKQLRPGLTWEEYGPLWDEFQRLKVLHAKH